MRFSFKKRLISLVFPILKLFGMPPQIPNGPEFDTEEVAVEIYLRLLQLEYQNPAESKCLRVVSATLWKQDSGSQHEYIVIKVETHQRENYYFAFERMPDSHPAPRSLSDTSLPPAEAHSLPPASSTPSPRGSARSRSPWPASPSLASLSQKPSLASLDSSSKDRMAKDLVKWLPESRKERTDFCVGTLSLPPDHEFYLYHIVALAAAVHKRHDLYRLFSQNCYFMAGIMMAVLESTCGSRMEKQKKVPKRFRDGVWFRVGKTFDPDDMRLVQAVQELRVEFDATVLGFEQGLNKKVELQEERNREIDSQAKEIESQAKEIESQAKEIESQAKEIEAFKEREREREERERELEKEMAALRAQLSARHSLSS
ncbi:hypothetical protein FPV67DRAFT_1677643 [Lyophyllum atratum]|nr:hypothetical protein FPV67DRAFT_1677643 [Lyophyllum atratum]